MEVKENQIVSVLQKIIADDYRNGFSVFGSLPVSLLEKIVKAAFLLSPSDDDASVLRTAKLILDDVTDTLSEPDTWQIIFLCKHTVFIRIHKDLPFVSVKYEETSGSEITISEITCNDSGCKKLAELYADTIRKMICKKRSGKEQQ